MSEPTPSKFCESIPPLQWAWDSTSLGLLKECPRKYQYQMILGYQPRGTSIHLSFGIAYHKALEIFEHYKAKGADHDEALRAAVQYAIQFKDPPDPNPNKNRETLVRSVIWHIDHYRTDPIQTYILANGKPAVEQSFRMSMEFENPDGNPFLLCGHLDRLGVLDDDLYFVDYKTTKSALSDWFFNQFTPNNQMSIYFAAAQAVFHKPAKGGFIDAVQLLVGGSRFARRSIRRTPQQMEEWHRELIWWLNQAAHYAEQNYWPMNDKACGNYGGCPFQSVCSVDPSLRSHILRTDFEKWDWNPLEIRGDL